MPPNARSRLGIRREGPRSAAGGSRALAVLSPPTSSRTRRRRCVETAFRAAREIVSRADVASSGRWPLLARIAFEPTASGSKGTPRRNERRALLAPLGSEGAAAPDGSAALLRFRARIARLERGSRGAPIRALTARRVTTAAPTRCPGLRAYEAPPPPGSEPMADYRSLGAGHDRPRGPGVVGRLARRLPASRSDFRGLRSSASPAGRAAEAHFVNSGSSEPLAISACRWRSRPATA
jgi:hypothetical protein